MAFTPPNPGFQSGALPAVRRLSWSPVDGDVGELVGGWLAPAACAEGRVLWCAGEGNAPAGLRPRYMTKDAFAAMRDGQLQQDGALAWSGQRWRLADVWEGARPVARLMVEGVAA